MVDVRPDDDYQYDIAFSFLNEDEPLAHKIDDLLKDRLRTFIYTRRQEQVAGTDGEITLNRVFGTEARMVIVLYRSCWGQTPFTRVEETAIRNRAYDQGFDFCIFVPLDGAAVPQWLPKTRIWPNLARWGLDGLAAIVEERVQALGGTSQEATASAAAVRLHQEIEAKRKRDSFLNSPAGFAAGQQEFGTLVDLLRSIMDELTHQSPSISAKLDFREDYVGIRSSEGSVILSWLPSSRSTLDNALLAVAVLNGFATGPEHQTMKKTVVVRNIEFNVDLQSTGAIGWRDAATGRLYSTQLLADECVKLLIEQIRASHFS